MYVCVGWVGGLQQRLGYIYGYIEALCMHDLDWDHSMKMKDYKLTLIQIFRDV